MDIHEAGERYGLVEVCRTYQRDWWESDEPDTEPSSDGGFVSDPDRPSGGSWTYSTEGKWGEAARAARAENTVRMSMWDAAKLITEVDCEVLDYDDMGEPWIENYHAEHLVYRRDCLHIDAGPFTETVFGLADQIKAGTAVHPDDR